MGTPVLCRNLLTVLATVTGLGWVQSLFGLGAAPAKININLTGNDGRLKKETGGGKGGSNLLPIYEAHEVRMKVVYVPLL